jgi:diketogulonate reductase-like aldo/keto reductase
VVPIPGSKRVERVEENAGATSVARALSDRDLQQIDELFPSGAAAGTRYAEGGMKTLNR